MVSCAAVSEPQFCHRFSPGLSSALAFAALSFVKVCLQIILDNNHVKPKMTNRGQQRSKSLIPRPSSNPGYKLDPDQNQNQDQDHDHEQFPNFVALTEDEKATFFQTLLTARDNVLSRGKLKSDRFGTIHDQYLEYILSAPPGSAQTGGTFTSSAGHRSVLPVPSFACPAPFLATVPQSAEPEFAASVSASPTLVLVPAAASPLSATSAPRELSAPSAFASSAMSTSTEQSAPFAFSEKVPATSAVFQIIIPPSQLSAPFGQSISPEFSAPFSLPVTTSTSAVAPFVSETPPCRSASSLQAHADADTDTPACPTLLGSSSSQPDLGALIFNIQSIQRTTTFFDERKVPGQAQFRNNCLDKAKFSGAESKIQKLNKDELVFLMQEDKAIVTGKAELGKLNVSVTVKGSDPRSSTLPVKQKTKELREERKKQEDVEQKEAEEAEEGEDAEDKFIIDLLAKRAGRTLSGDMRWSTTSVRTQGRDGESCEHWRGLNRLAFILILISYFFCTQMNSTLQKF